MIARQEKHAIDFPSTDVLDHAASTTWFEAHLHPNRLHCPHCGHANRWLFRHQEYFDAYRYQGSATKTSRDTSACQKAGFRAKSRRFYNYRALQHMYRLGCNVVHVPTGLLQRSQSLSELFRRHV